MMENRVYIVEEKHGDQWVPTGHIPIANIKAAYAMKDFIKPGMVAIESRIVEYVTARVL